MTRVREFRRQLMGALAFLVVGASVLPFLSPIPAEAAVVSKAPSSPSGGVNVRGSLPYNANSAPAKMIADGNGGAYMVWKEQRNGINTDVDIYAQHFNSDGGYIWTEGGVKVTTLYTGAWSGGVMFPDWNPEAVRDNDNNLIVVWTANYNNKEAYVGFDDEAYYAQKLDFNTGALQWSNSRPVSGSHGYTTIDADPIPLEVSASNQYLFVALTFNSTDGLASVDDVLWNGTGLTQICADVGSNAGGTHYSHIELWGIANPAVGSFNATFSVSGETDVNVSADVFTNVDGADPIYASGCIDGGTGGGPSGTGIQSLSDNSVRNDQGVVSVISWGEAASAGDITTLFATYRPALVPHPKTELEAGYTNPDQYLTAYAMPTEADGTTTINWGLNGSYGSARDWSMGSIVFNLSTPNPLFDGIELLNPASTTDTYNFRVAAGIDGYGVAVFAANNGTQYIEGQYVNTNGVKQWNSGSPLQMVANVNGFLSASSDYLGYYVLAQRVEGGTDNRLRAFRYGSDGALNDTGQGFINNVLLDEEVVGVGSFPYVMVVPDDGGGMTALYRKDSGPVELYAQRVHADGSVGTAILVDGTFNDGNDRAVLARDTSSTAANTWYVAWYTDATHVAAQRYSFDTLSSVWGSDVAVATLTSHESLIELAEDGDNGIFVIASDNTASNHLVQGVRVDGSLLWDSTATLDLEDGTGRPSMARLSSGNVGAVWEETRSGQSALFFFQRLTSLFQIRSLSGLQAETTAGTNITFGSGNGVNNAAETVRVVDTGNDYPVSAITVNLTTDRSWSSVAGDVDTTNKKSYVTNLTSAPGAAATHTLYVPYDSTHDSVIICPNATSLAEVTTSCTGAVTKTEADADTSIETIDGKQVWAITGMTGTGGIGYDSPSTTATPATGTVNLLSPTGSTSQSQPTLTFSLAQNTTNGVSSYTVTLDGGKNLSWSVSGIPATGNGTNDYVWRDNEDVRVVFLNQGDSDASNDQVSVTFKDLGAEPLSPGQHGWSVTLYDNSSNSLTTNASFTVDSSAPNASGLSLSGLGSWTNNMVYTGSVLHRLPAVSGTLTDGWQTSTTTHQNGSTDTYGKGASGLKNVTLVIEKLTVPGSGTTPAQYSLYAQATTESFTNTGENAETGKFGQFSVAAPFPLVDGSYRLTLIVRDSAGNSATIGPIYLQYGVIPAFLATSPDDGAPLETQLGDDEVIVPSTPSGTLLPRTPTSSLDAAATEPRTLREQLTTLLAALEPVAQAVVVQAEKAAPVAPAAAAAMAATTAAGASLALAFVPSRGFSPKLALKILQTLLDFRPHYPQGILYDTVTYQPVPFTVLSLFELIPTGKRRQRSHALTDRHGVYYGLQPKTGTYTLTAEHKGYAFPSSHPRPAYETVHEFYRGEPFTVSEANAKRSAFVLPVDKVQKRTQSLSDVWRMVLSFSHAPAVTAVFAVTTIASTLLHASPINLALTAGYVALILLKISHWLRFRSVSGRVTTSSGVGVAGTVVELFTPDGALAAITLSDRAGHYHLTAPRKSYLMRYTHADYAPAQSGQLTLDLRKGSVRQTLRLR